MTELTPKQIVNALDNYIIGQDEVSKEGKVLTDPLTLAEYLRRNRTEGIRIIRLTE